MKKQALGRRGTKTLWRTPLLPLLPLLLLPTLLALGGCRVVTSRLRIAFGIPAPRPPFLALKPMTTDGWGRVAIGRLALRLPPKRDNEDIQATVDGIELGRREMDGLNFEQIWAEHHKLIDDGQGDIQPPHTTLKLYDAPAGHEKTERTALFEENLGSGPADVLEHWEQIGRLVFWGRTRFAPVELADNERRMAEVFGNLRLDANPGAGDFAFHEAAIHLPAGPRENLSARWDLYLPVERGSAAFSIRLMLFDTSPKAQAAGAPVSADSIKPSDDPLSNMDRSQWTLLRAPTQTTLGDRVGYQEIFLRKSPAFDKPADLYPFTEDYSANWTSDEEPANGGGGTASLVSFDASSGFPPDWRIITGNWDAIGSSLRRR